MISRCWRIQRHEGDDETQRRSQNSQPPYDQDRDGFVMGEAAGLWCSKNSSTPKPRAQIYLRDLAETALRRCPPRNRSPP